jgi:hypothetical protein
MFGCGWLNLWERQSTTAAFPLKLVSACRQMARTADSTVAGCRWGFTPSGLSSGSVLSPVLAQGFRGGHEWHYEHVCGEAGFVLTH